MSLWDKWERVKLEKQGIKVEHHRDVEIHETHPKADTRKQIWIVVGAFFACIAVVFLALAFEAVYNGRRWSDTYIVRLFAERQAQREAMSRNQ